MQIIRVEYKCDGCGVVSDDPFDAPSMDLVIDGKSRRVDMCKACIEPYRSLWEAATEIPDRPAPKIRARSKPRNFEGFPKTCEFEGCGYLAVNPTALGAHKWHKHGVKGQHNKS